MHEIPASQHQHAGSVDIRVDDQFSALDTTKIESVGIHLERSVCMTRASIPAFTTLCFESNPESSTSRHHRHLHKVDSVFVAIAPYSHKRATLVTDVGALKHVRFIG